MDNLSKEVQFSSNAQLIRNGFCPPTSGRSPGDIALLVECLSCMTPRLRSLAAHKPGVVVHSSNPNNKMEVGESEEVRDDPRYIRGARAA